MRATTRRGSFKGKVGFNSTQQRNKTASGGYLMVPRGIPIYKEEAGSRIQMDILPYLVTDEHHPDRDDDHEIATKGSLWYRRPYRLHRNIGANNNAFVCPTSVGRKCPICEYRTRLLADGTSWQDSAVKALRASDRDLYYVVPKNDKKLDDKPHLWDISQFLFQAKLNDELEENEEYETFPDLEDGYTLRIRFSEEKIEKTTYADTSRIDFEKRDYKYEESEIEKLPSLDDVLIIKDYKALEQAFFETSSTEAAEAAEAGQATDDDDGPKATPIPTRSLTRSPAPADAKPVTSLSRGKPAEQTPPAEESERVDPPVEAPRSTRERPRPAAVQDKTERCPHGHKFGVEGDKHPECEDCKIWGHCMDAMEAANAT